MRKGFKPSKWKKASPPPKKKKAKYPLTIFYYRCKK